VGKLEQRLSLREQQYPLLESSKPTNLFSLPNRAGLGSRAKQNYNCMRLLIYNCQDLEAADIYTLVGLKEMITRQNREPGSFTFIPPNAWRHYNTGEFSTPTEAIIAYQKIVDANTESITERDRS